MALHICQLHNVHFSPVMKMVKLSGPTAVKIIRNGRGKKTIRDSKWSVSMLLSDYFYSKFLISGEKSNPSVAEGILISVLITVLS